MLILKEARVVNRMIFEQAQQCRRRFHTSDPYELLDGMGVVLIHSSNYSRNGLRGYCTVMNKTSYVVISTNQPEEEQRVVAGHEAGHLILHQTQLKAGAMSDFDVYNVGSRLERQANLFAADFLLSDDDVTDVMHQDADFYDAAKELLIPAPFFAFKLYSMMQRGYNMNIPVDLNSTFLKRDARKG